MRMLRGGETVKVLAWIVVGMLTGAATGAILNGLVGNADSSNVWLVAGVCGAAVGASAQHKKARARQANQRPATRQESARPDVTGRADAGSPARTTLPHNMFRRRCGTLARPCDRDSER
jgi:hypothetical protein